MADFPFKPFAVGNLCSACCEDCISRLNDPDAKCCQSLGSTISIKECYKPKIECKICQTISNDPLTQKVISYCTDPEYGAVREKKTSCCNGECYDNCYKCESNALVENYNSSIEGCCAGTKFPIDCKNCCYICKETPQSFTNIYGDAIAYTQKTLIQNKCTDSDSGYWNPNTPDCCWGTCWNSTTDKCTICDDQQKKLISKCPALSGDQSLTNCCNGECIDPKNQCKECVDDPNNPGFKIYRSVDNCGECCGPNSNGISVCCQTQRCCGTTNECYDPKCSECG
jgi:hypothetical protein